MFIFYNVLDKKIFRGFDDIFLVYDGFRIVLCVKKVLVFFLKELLLLLNELFFVLYMCGFFLLYFLNGVLLSFYINLIMN